MSNDEFILLLKNHLINNRVDIHNDAGKINLKSIQKHTKTQSQDEVKIPRYKMTDSTFSQYKKAF